MSKPQRHSAKQFDNRNPTRVTTNGGKEFDRFAALTKQLVNVPKKEIDEQREQDPRAKA